MSIESDVKRIREIGAEIAALSEESKLLRVLVGKILAPEPENPAEFHYRDGGSVVSVCVSVPDDENLKDFTVTFKDLPAAP